MQGSNPSRITLASSARTYIENTACVFFFIWFAEFFCAEILIYAGRVDRVHIASAPHPRRVRVSACKSKGSTAYGKPNVCVVGVGYSLRNLCVGWNNFWAVRGCTRPHE